MYLLFTFPYYLIYLEIGIITEKMRSLENNWIDIIGLVAVFGVIITSFNFWVLFLQRYIFSALLVISWIADVGIYKRKDLFFLFLKKRKN